ncbi:MAG: hypothetical protein GEV06_11785 [Luteitalea sp.]|nr:hypothetical protein [Luteitalea sp.]
MNALSCADVGERLSAFRDGAMPIDEQRAVRAHLSSCPACAGEVAAFDSVGTLLRASVRARTSEQQDDLANLPIRVVSQISAERNMAWPNRMGRLFEDWHLVWAGLSGTTSAALCLLLVALLSAALSPGTDRNPVSIRDAEVLPQVLAGSSTVMPAALVSSAVQAGELELALSGVVTREGRLANPELVNASFSEEVARLMIRQLAETRFEPASHNGSPVAVRVVWLFSRTTVRPPAPADIGKPGASLAPPLHDNTAA